MLRDMMEGEVTTTDHIGTSHPLVDGFSFGTIRYDSLSVALSLCVASSWAFISAVPSLYAQRCVWCMCARFGFCFRPGSRSGGKGSLAASLFLSRERTRWFSEYVGND